MSDHVGKSLRGQDPEEPLVRIYIPRARDVEEPGNMHDIGAPES